jgi:hypothetical protein
MGWVNGSDLKPAGDYLLGILKAEGSVPYSRFYNRDTDYAALAAAVAGRGEEDDEDDVDEEHVHLMIEFAAGQLEDAGLVMFTPLDRKLVDGEPDYTITLTDKGRAFDSSGEAFRYRDMNL